MSLFDSEYAPRERRVSRRQRWGYSAIALAVACAVLFALTPSPYVIEQPGPVYDTLGTVSADGTDVPVISIEGTTSYPTIGTLDMLTVSIVGNRESQLSWIEAGMAWFSPHRALLPMDAIFPVGQTTEQQSQQNATLMVNSQQDAIAAALINLGYPVTREVTVSGLSDTSPAAGILRTGDIITEANGQPVQTVAELRSQINAVGPAPVTVTVLRSGQSQDVSITPTTADDGSFVLGIGASVAYEFPFDVSFQLDNVGGPSAGMMFALGIIAKLTPTGDLTGGKHWAGTGTITADGEVGAIGGIAQKMAGARSAGADYMLAPQSNCDEVVGNIPNGLDVYAVSTLEQAKTVVQTIASGADTSQLARCSAQ